MTRHIILSILLFLGCLRTFGQESSTEIRVGFRVGSSVLDPAFGENAARLSEIISFLDNIRDDSTTELTGVTFSGSASPDGRAVYNRRLSADRMEALDRYVRGRVAIPDSIVTRKSNGIAWELLAELVEASDMPDKAEVQRIIRDVPEAVFDKSGRLVDSRKKQLMDLRRGRTWNYMNEHFFDRLRNACTVMFTMKQLPVLPPKETEQPKQETVLAPVDTVEAITVVEPVETAVSDTVPQPAERKPFYMAVKTNMLYDILALPNVGLEFYLGKNWSIAANWMYGWWDSDRRHRYWRAYGGDIAVRKWFGRAADSKPLTGHHLGVYGQILTYDFEFGGKGQMAGEPGKPLWSQPSYAAGVEYGYSLPIARRLNIDFTIGIGYLGGKYYEYEPIDGHYVWQATKQRHWFGPTKAEISLVWLLGHGNHNERKGGAK